MPDLSLMHYRLLPPRQNFALLRFAADSPLDLFLRFLPSNFLRRILDAVPHGHWSYNEGGRIHTVDPTLRKAYTNLAIYLRLIFRSHDENHVGDDFTTRSDAVRLAKQHFTAEFPDIQFPSCHISDIMFANVHITGAFFAELENFNSVLSELGAFVAGDEKLLHFTGNGVHVMSVKSKPDRIGLWYYELAVKLECGAIFVIYIRMNNSNDFEGVHIPVDAVVRDWVDAIQHGGQREVDPNILLSFDNYYMSNASRLLLLERNQRFAGACKKTTFQDLSDESE